MSTGRITFRRVIAAYFAMGFVTMILVNWIAAKKDVPGVMGAFGEGEFAGRMLYLVGMGIAPIVAWPIYLPIVIAALIRPSGVNH